jgi:hypothetical protein
MRRLLGSFSIMGLTSVAAAALAVLAGTARADTIYLSTAAGATDSVGDPVSATAVVTTGTNSVTVTLQNLLVNQKDVGQNISDFGFQLSSGTTATLDSSSGTERTVADNGSFTDGSTVSTGWGLDATTTGLIHLNVLGTATAPTHTIIGEPGAGGTYSNANDSIAKTGGSHNPFLSGIVTFDLTVAGVTADTTLSNPFFSFGTTAGNNVTAVPLPASMWGGLGLLGVVAAVAARKRMAC